MDEEIFGVFLVEEIVFEIGDFGVEGVSTRIYIHGGY